MKTKVRKTFYGYVRYPGVMYGPFGSYDLMGQKNGYGTIGIQPPEELGMLGHGAEVEVTFKVLKRGVIKKNPWHDGIKGRPEPPAFPEDCTSRGIIVGPVAEPT